MLGRRWAAREEGNLIENKHIITVNVLYLSTKRRVVDKCSFSKRARVLFNYISFIHVLARLFIFSIFTFITSGVAFVCCVSDEATAGVEF